MISKLSSLTIFTMESGTGGDHGLLQLHFQAPIQLVVPSQRILAMMVCGQTQRIRLSSIMTTSKISWLTVGDLNELLEGTPKRISGNWLIQLTKLKKEDK